MTIDPEREAFFLHWEASMALERGSFVVGRWPDWDDDTLLDRLIEDRWPDFDDERKATVRALALDHLRNACNGVIDLPDYDWLPVAIWGAAATRAARKAADCMEMAWLDASGSAAGRAYSTADVDNELAELIRRMRDE